MNDERGIHNIDSGRCDAWRVGAARTRDVALAHVRLLYYFSVPFFIAIVRTNYRSPFSMLKMPK